MFGSLNDGRGDNETAQVVGVMTYGIRYRWAPKNKQKVFNELFNSNAKPVEHVEPIGETKPLDGAKG